MTLNELTKQITELQTVYFISGDSPVVDADGNEICSVKAQSRDLDNNKKVVLHSAPRQCDDSAE